MSIEEIYSGLGIITNISYVPIFFLILFSGLYKKHIGFASYMLLFAIWGYADYKMGGTEDYLDIWRQYNFCAILLPVSFFLFTQDFTHKKSNLITGVILGLSALFLFLNYYNNLLIPDIVLELTGLELMREIPLYNLFAIYACGVVFLSTFWMMRYYGSNNIIYKWMIIGYTLTSIGEIYSYGTVYFEGLYNYPYISYFGCFLPYFLTYLIFRHRLFDARSTLLKMLQGGFIVGIGALVGAGVYKILGMYGYYPHIDIPLISILIAGAIVIFLLAKSNHVHKWFQLSDMRTLEHDVGDFLASSVVHESINEIVEDITFALKSGLKINDIKLINRSGISNYPELTKKLAYIPKVIQGVSLKETKNEVENTGKKIAYLAEMESLGELCIPIYIEHKLSYFLILPEKKSQANYTENELRVINSMRQKIALSLQVLEYNQILRDEVERQTLQINEQNKKLEASYQKLETLDHEKDVFMNMAAHELRTPMTIIRGYADILLEGSTGTMAPAQKKLTENILRGSQSLLDLVNDLLDLSRIDAGKMELKYEPCDIKQFTYDTYENFKGLMAKKNMQFKLEESLDTNYELFTDKAKLTLIYNNLISNAYKYTPEHGDVIFQTSTVVEDNIAWLTFSITDSGIGIPNDEIPRLFDRFANISTHNDIAATIQSTGLGLSIVKKIITGMSGTIIVTSTVGKGSTFTVRLPYNK